MNVSSGRDLKRVRHSYVANHTIARMIELPFKKKGYQTTDLLRHPSIIDATCDHAYRRVQILFAQASVYHGKGCDVWRGKTRHQHGTSNYPWSSAAHSAILPNVEDSLGLIHPSSHLYQVMNSTVELPHVVNEYDCVIEGVMREESVILLNRVSKEGLSPYAATELFVRKMEGFFIQSKSETLEKIELLKKIASLEHLIWQKEKTVNASNITSYLDLLQNLGEHSRTYHKMYRYSIHRRLRKRLPWQSNFISLHKPYSRKIKAKVLKKITRSKEWVPKSAEELLSKQHHALTILAIQKTGTTLPSLQFLNTLCGNS